MFPVIELPQDLQTADESARQLGLQLADLIGSHGAELEIKAGHYIEPTETPSWLILVDGYLQGFAGEARLFDLAAGDVILLQKGEQELRLFADFAGVARKFDEATLATALSANPKAVALWLQIEAINRTFLAAAFTELTASRRPPATAFKEYAPGEVIISEGDEATAVYELLDGEAVVDVKGREVSRIMPGDIFGEMSFLTQRPRAATVRALTHCEVQGTSRDDFLTMIQLRPTMLTSIAKQLAERVVQLDEQFVSP